MGALETKLFIFAPLNEKRWFLARYCLFSCFCLHAVLLGNFILPFRFRNYFLLLSSFVFFAWGGVSYSLLLVLSVLINYSVGLLIHRFRNTNGSKVALGIGVALNLSILVVFKYVNFFVENINYLGDVFHYNKIDIGTILLPIGISFYTFQAISYLVDLFRKQVGVQKNLADLALYIFLFPQLIAGPIIRYHDISNQIKSRQNNLDNFRHQTFNTWFGQEGHHCQPDGHYCGSGF